jgi:hypothetical protein
MILECIFYYFKIVWNITNFKVVRYSQSFDNFCDHRWKVSFYLWFIYFLYKTYLRLKLLIVAGSSFGFIVFADGTVLEVVDVEIGGTDQS